MEPFLEREEATTTSQLVGILPGDPPRVNLVDYASGRSGVKRHFTQQVPVLDKDLLARLQAEVGVGDYIRATVVNEYTERGSRAYLAGFQKANDPATIGSNGVKNGTRDMSQIPLATSVTKPILQPKTKVR